MKPIIIVILSILLTVNVVSGTDFHIGPLQSYQDINDLPWESLNPGDHVYIHYRNLAQGGDYHEKWVINVQGTISQPFTITGVLGPNGERPVINGDGATTRTQLSYWNEERSVIKVGGSSIPSDGMPSYIVIENLEIKSGHKNYNFRDDNGNAGTYVNNAASIHVEKVNNLTIRNCVIHDSGNGIFIASGSNDITIENNYIYGNGNVGRFFEHNTYTEATNITYQFNRLGPLRTGADGNNLKDRSAGLVVRYNWIEGGNRLMDLVDTGSSAILNNPDYRKTLVYGNIMVEEDGGNSQVLHYGGDSGTTTQYRKGKLYFYNNTVYSIRSGNTTLARLTSNDESADIRNNIIYVVSGGSTLAILDAAGTATLKNNLMKSNWVFSHQGAGFTGTINDDGSSVETSDPGFNDGPGYDFSLLPGSIASNAGTVLHADVQATHDVDMEYVTHQSGQLRPVNGSMDIGGYENSAALPVVLAESFKARIINDHVELSWASALEYNINKYIISKNEDVEWRHVNTSGGIALTHYQQRDLSPSTGTSIYRLWERDFEENKNLLGEAVINIENKIISIYPNPCSNILNVYLPENGGQKKITIYNLMGQIIREQKLNNNDIDVSDLPSGQYLLQSKIGNIVYTNRFYKN